MAEAAQKMAEGFPIALTIERVVLLKSLARLQSIVEKRNTLPILSNIKLDARDGALTLTATDMDIVAAEKVSASIETEGSLTIPAQTLYDIVRKLPEGSQIAIKTNEASSQITVQSGSAKFNISYLPSDEFPIMSEGDLSHHFTLPADECLTLIEKSRFAMSTEETRYYLNGVYFHSTQDDDGNLLKSVATDGHRLARIEVAQPKGAEGMPGVIIPRKTVNELHKLLGEQGTDVEIALSESKIRFTSGNISILSKLVDGTFPDYVRVIPEGNNNILEIDPAVLTQAVDRVSTISTDKSRGIKFSLSSGTLTLSAQSPESGSATETVSVNYDADDIEIGFNSRYMLEMLGQLDGETAQFRFSDANSPALVNDPNDVRVLYVIMPMRV